MKINKIKFVFGLAAIVAFLAVGCQKEEDPTANLTQEQKSSMSDEEAASVQDAESMEENPADQRTEE